MTRFATIGRWLVIAAVVVFIAGTIGTIYLATRSLGAESGPIGDTYFRVQILIASGGTTLTASGILGIGGLLLQAFGSVIDEDDEDALDVAP
jgi:hypothetical protein